MSANRACHGLIGSDGYTLEAASRASKSEGWCHEPAALLISLA
jgi:hypothetical protein